MATKINYNDFGAEMVDNRPILANQLDSEEMTRNEWKKYLSICDKVATTAYAYMAEPEKDGFPAFRSAMHELYAFVGADTRILAIDGYSVRFIPAVVPYKVVKSKAYKDAEKDVRVFKRAIEWACIVSEVSPENPEAVLFPKATNTDELSARYFHKDTQDYYNLCVKFFKSAMASNHDLQVKELSAELARLESVRDELGQQKWNCYKDFKDPMLSANGKTKLKHVPASIRKNIEDTMADILTARSLMTTAQLDKEEAQIKGGKKQEKHAKEAAKAQESK